MEIFRILDKLFNDYCLKLEDMKDFEIKKDLAAEVVRYTGISIPAAMVEINSYVAQRSHPDFFDIHAPVCAACGEGIHELYTYCESCGKPLHTKCGFREATENTAYCSEGCVNKEEV